MILNEPIIILANGDFPSHHIPLKKLEEAQSIICLDGAISNLAKNKIEPDLIIGDLDSISTKYKEKYDKIIIHDASQDENDLRKALYWLNQNNYTKATILGATGKREDHSIGNIFSILDMNISLDAKIITDHGTFETIKGETEISSYKGQQISFFTSGCLVSIEFAQYRLK